MEAAGYTRLLENAGSIIRNLIPILIFLAFWEIAPRVGIVNPLFIPPLSDVNRELLSMIASGEIFTHVGVSLLRAMEGFSLSMAVGLTLGIAIGWNRKVREFLSPLLTLFGNVSPIALFPFFIIILGIGEVSKVGIVFWGCLWPILMNTISGVSNANKLLIKAARTMGASQMRVLFRVVIPDALPEIFPGIRLSASNSILMLCAAEMLGASAGLGYLISYSQQVFQLTKMYAAIILIALLGLLFTWILERIEKSLFIWKGEK